MNYLIAELFYIDIIDNQIIVDRHSDEWFEFFDIEDRYKWAKTGKRK